MKIGILGSGLMGSKLGLIWGRCGHDVTFAYSRNPAKLERLAREIGGTHASVADAVEGTDVILLAVHRSHFDDILDQAGNLDGQIVLNCCVPLNDSNTEIVVGMSNSGAEELARKRPKARWVSTFNTSPSESFDPVFDRKGHKPHPHLLVYGEDAEAKKVAGNLIRDIGFEPLEAGGLHTARFVEPFAMVTAVLSYEQPGGPELTYRFEKLCD